MSPAAPHEARRRALHVAFAAFGLAWYARLSHRTMTLMLASLVALALALELARRASPGFGRALERLSAGMMREGEAQGITGATLLALGGLIAWLAFPADAAAPAIIVAALADPAAALVGTRVSGSFGRKTWAGTAGAFLTGLLALIVVRAGWPAAPVAAAIAALVERGAARGLDNLLVPPITAAAITALS